jgi:hypothetical protein
MTTMIRAGGVLAALACLALPATASAVAPSFAAAQHPGAVGPAKNLAVGDIDGANGPDLAYTTSGTGSNKVELLRNRGDGTFGPVTRYLTAPAPSDDPRALALMRFDRGPTTDLMIAGSIGLTLRLGGGDGTFGALAASGLPGEDLAVEDLNGDGAQDAVLTQAVQRTIAVLPGRGDGKLELQRLVTGDARHWPRAVAIADVNADQRPDFVVGDEDESSVATYVGGVTLFINRPSGYVRSYLPYRLGGPNDLAVADFNEDGIPDIAVSNDPWFTTSVVSLLRGTGGGSFAAPITLPVSGGAHGVAVADFNADGHRDIAVASDDTSVVSVLAGRGDGSFDAVKTFPVGPGAFNPHDLATADINRDGAVDLVSSSSGTGTVGGVSLFLNRVPNPGARPHRSRPALVRSSTRWLLRDSLSGGPATTAFDFGTVPQRTIMGDWDGDGTQTPGTYTGGTFSLRDTNANGPANLTFAFGNPNGYPVAGDFDGDGRDDVAVYSGSAWQVRLRTGGTSSFTFGSGTWPATVPVAGDWDGDGRDGIGTYTAATATWRLRPSATSGPTEQRFDYGTPGSSYPVTGDWNADARDTIGVKSGASWNLRDSNGGGPADIAFSYGTATDQPLSWRMP